MKTAQSPILATRLLERLAPGPHGDALAGDLIEQYREGRSKAWYWRQALLGILVCLAKDRTLGGFAVLGSLLVILLMIVSVARHPASLGSGLFSMDITLLCGYGAFSMWGWRQRDSEVRNALAAGAQTGLMLGLILVLSHAIEWLRLDGSRATQFARGAGSTLLLLGLLGAAGSAAFERTRSIKLGAIAGVWCGSLAMMLLLGFALILNLTSEAQSLAALQEAFVSSGMRDPGAFVVRNALEAASEILVRLTIAGVVLSLIGGFANASIVGRSRSVSLSSAWIMPFVFAGGVISLWHAGSLDRAARPPFVMAGVFAAGLAVCSAHPIWSSVARTRRAQQSQMRKEQ